MQHFRQLGRTGAGAGDQDEEGQQQLKEEERGVGITFKEESASEEGIAQKEEVIFQLVLSKEGIVV